MDMVDMVLTLGGLFRIGAAGEDSEGAVELLSEHDAGEFVGESHGAERKSVVSALAERFWEAVGVATEKDEFTSAAVAEFAEPLGKAIRIEVFSGGVEKDNRCGAVRVQLLERDVTVPDLSDFDRTGTADALCVIIEDGTYFGAAGLAEH